jgi:hypothetical protein
MCSVWEALAIAPIFCLLLTQTLAQSNIQSLLWNVPDGKAQDLSLTFTNGVTLPLSWNNWSYINYIDASKNHVDLWATSFDWNLNQYAEVVKSKFVAKLPILHLYGPNSFADLVNDREH